MSLFKRYSNVFTRAIRPKFLGVNNTDQKRHAIRLKCRAMLVAARLPQPYMLRPAIRAGAVTRKACPRAEFHTRSISSSSSRPLHGLSLPTPAKSSSGSSAKPSPKSGPHFLFDPYFYRTACFTYLIFALPYYYITSTTLSIHGIQGESMYPLLCPSSTTLLQCSASSLPPNSPSQATLLANPHSKDNVLALPTSSAWPRFSSLLRLLSFCKLLPPSPFHNDPSNYTLRLDDDPISEGGKGTRSNLERGMIVVFTPPYEPGHGYDPDRLAIKRIVGLEGDIVVPLGPVDGNFGTTEGLGRQRLLQAWKDGSDMDDICSGKWVEMEVEDRDGDVKMMAGVKVPYGHVWVEGVNQASTVDSNDYGVISKSLIQGVAIGVLWPRGRECDWRKSWRKDCRKRVFRVKDGKGVLVKREEKISEELDPEWAI